MSAPSHHADLMARAAKVRGVERSALLSEEQLRRWENGDRVRLESYLSELPDLAGDADALLDLIYLEVVLREAHGERVEVEEYQQRFTDHADRLERLFFMHQRLRQEELPIPEGMRTRTAHPQVPAAEKIETTDAPTLAAEAQPPSTRDAPPRIPAEAGTLTGNPPVLETANASVLVPGYEVYEEVGKGGMGVVYRARQLGLNRIVALKMLLAGTHASSDQLERFRLETEAVGRLQHPSIVQIYQVGEHQGRTFCCLEYVAGGSLDHKLNGQPQPPREAARLVWRLAQAMHVAHEAGVVHRDLKPGNILLAPDGTPKITDFGIAKLLDSESWRTHSGAIIGTPSYMAPEQASGRNRDVTPATDVYALGAILYECLTGRPPFQAATMLDTLEQVRYQEPVPPHRLQPKVPRDLETICLKCLRKEQAQRYPAARDLAEDLERFLKDQPIRGRPVPLWERGLKWAKRQPATAALVIVSTLAALGLVGGVVVYLHQRARGAEQELLDRQRRDEVQQFVLEGERAVAGADWSGAQLHLERALGRIAPGDDSLAEVRGKAEDLLRQVQQRLEAGKERQGALDLLRRFSEKRDQVLFHATLATGAGFVHNVQASRQAARDALRVLGAMGETSGILVLSTSLTAPEKSDLLDACYELLLVFAESQSQVLPEEGAEEQLRSALTTLDRAARIGSRVHPTQSWHLRRARYLEQLGKLPEARGERERAAARPPATAPDHYLVGDEHYKEGAIAEAVQQFELALRLQPDHFWAQYFHAVCCLRMGRAAEAKTGLTACLVRQPKLVWLYLLRGFAQGQLNQFEAAEADFRTALALDPDRDAAHVLYANRGALWFQQGKTDEAIADLQRAIELKPTEYQARVTLAQVYQSQKKWTEAAAQFDQAIEQEPEVPTLLRLRARLQLERPEPDLAAALRDFERAIGLEQRAGPSTTLARDHAERGRILHRQQQYADAVKAFDEAIALHAASPRFHLWRAETLFQLEKPEEACRSVDEYLKRGGKPTAEVYRARGLAQSQLGRYPEAIQDFTLALRLGPDHARTYAARGWACLATAAYQLALADFEEAIRREPTSGDAYNGRGFALVKLGRYRPGVADAEAALRNGPPNWRLYHDAARIYAQAMAALENDPGERTRQALEQRAAWQDQAVQLLQRAVQARAPGERAAFWRERIGNDNALAPIRQATGYKRLEQEYRDFQGARPGS